MKQQTDCPFCRIARGEAPAFIVYEDASVMAILDTRPCTDGHCLIIPRQHTRQFYELDDDQLTRLFLAVKLVAGKIKKAFAADYVCLFSRGGRLAHAHIALFPSFEHDEVSGFPQSVVNKASLSLKEVAEKIRRASCA